MHAWGGQMLHGAWMPQSTLPCCSRPSTASPKTPPGRPCVLFGSGERTAMPVETRPPLAGSGWRHCREAVARIVPSTPPLHRLRETSLPPSSRAPPRLCDGSTASCVVRRRRPSPGRQEAMPGAAPAAASLRARALDFSCARRLFALPSRSPPRHRDESTVPPSRGALTATRTRRRPTSLRRCRCRRRSPRKKCSTII